MTKEEKDNDTSKHAPAARGGDPAVRRLSVPLILDRVKAAGLELAGGGCMDAAILTWSWNRINPKTDTSAGIFPH